MAERARRELAERRDRTLRDQIAKEAQAQQELRRERDHVLDEAAELKRQLDETTERFARPSKRSSQRCRGRSARRKRAAASPPRPAEPASAPAVERRSSPPPSVATATVAAADHAPELALSPQATSAPPAEETGPNVVAIVWGGILFFLVVGLIVLAAGRI